MKYFREQKNRFLGLIFFLVLLHIIVFLIWKVIVWMGHVAYSMPLSQLIVTGERFYTTDNDIRQSVFSIVSIGSVITQDISLIQKKIKSLPWIKKVSVRRQWPDKLKIYIIEYVPVAFWNRLYMITKDAVVFSVPKKYVHQQSYPILFGPDGSERYVLSNYYIFSKVLESSGLSIKLLNMDYRYSWEVILQDNVKLILGRKSSIARLRRFIKIYPIFFKKYVNKADEYISYIDLRYKSGFSLKKVRIVRDGR